jgi:NAD(P)-dependent dehydrogenase (short-subunit alcohol dehydrogenase family)
VNVTRAVLPVLRAQRQGLIVTISSTGGIAGQAFVSAYSAAKFAVEGWMESLAPEVAPFGIRTMLVEPGFFRTELLTDGSTKWPEASIADYAATTRETVAAWKRMNGTQGGDPAKLATALVQLAGEAETAAALARRRRRRRGPRDEGQRIARASLRPPGPLLLAARSTTLVGETRPAPKAND